MLFETYVYWCGRMILGDGLRIDPCRNEGIRNIFLLSTGAGYEQLV